MKKQFLLLCLLMGGGIGAQGGLKPKKEKQIAAQVRTDFTPLYVTTPWIRRLEAGVFLGMPLITQTPSPQDAHIAGSMLGFSGGFFFDFEYFKPPKASTTSLGFVRDKRGSQRRSSLKGKPHPFFSLGLLTSVDFIHATAQVNSLYEIYQTIVVTFFLKYYWDFRYLPFLKGKIGNQMSAGVGLVFMINPVFHNIVEDTQTGFVRSGPLNTAYLLGPGIQLRYRLRPDLELVFFSKTAFPLNPQTTDDKKRGGKRSLQQYFQLGIGLAL